MNNIFLFRFRKHMRHIAVFVFFLGGLSLQLKAQQLRLEEVRKQYVEGVEKEKVAESLWKALNGKENVAPVFIAYRGAVKALLAKHAFLVTKKYNYAVESMRILANAVSLQPENIEIRYLRYTIQFNMPSFLGLSGDKAEDRKGFLAYMSQRENYGITPDYFREMARFMISTREFTASEVQTIKQEAGL